MEILVVSTLDESVNVDYSQWIAVTDKTESGFSAFYTFFNPHIAPRSLGTFMILQQIEFCQTFNLPYLYLGYQIDECRKMNYKNAFSPNQRFNGEFWV